MFAIPFFVVFLIFQLYPLILTFYNSLIYSQKVGRSSTDVFGFGNFTHYVFGHDGLNDVWHALGVTIVLWILNFIPQILLSLLLAAWFTDIKYKLKGNGAYKVIMYMPNIITAATIAVLYYSMFSAKGPLTILMQKMHMVGSDGVLQKVGGHL